VFLAGMSSPYLAHYTVIFRGPPLTRMTRGALSAAAVELIERRADDAWGKQMQRYVVSVEARDIGDAIGRVRATVENHGFYSTFSASPQAAGEEPARRKL
jgi:hypothetical protein